MADELLDGGGEETPPPASSPELHPVDAANIMATRPGEPSGHWSLEGVADPNDAQKKMQDFLRTHAMAGRPYEDTKANWDIAFPGRPLESETYKAWQERGGQERLLDHVRFQAARDRPTISGVNLALGPLGADLSKGVMYGNAQQRFNEGAATGEDYGVIAHYENEQRIRAEHASTTGGKLNTLALELPGHLTALMAGGKVAQAFTPAALAAAPGVAAGAARLGIEAIANPAMTPQMWVQRNVAEGKDPFDITGLPAAAAVATLQAGVYKASSLVGGAVGGKAMPSAGEVAKAIGAGASGPVTQAIADGATYLAGLDSRYGTFQDFMEGKYGDMWSGIAKDALMNGILHVAHGGGPDEVKASLDDVKARLDALAKKGYSRDSAAKELLAESKPPIDTPASIPADARQGPPEAQGTTRPPEGQGAPETAPGESGAPKTGGPPAESYGVSDEQVAKRLGMTPEWVAEHAESGPVKAVRLQEGRDPLTGFGTAPQRDAAVAGAAKSGGGVYVDMDVANMKGLAEKAGDKPAWDHVRRMGEIVRDTLKEAGIDVDLFRHAGDPKGDELSAVARGDGGAVKAALDTARERIGDYVRENGLADVPHTKEGGKPGTGLDLGTAEIKPGTTARKAAEAAEAETERSKREAKGSPDWLKEAIDRHYETAKRAGVAEDVERLSAEGKVAKEVRNDLMERFRAAGITDQSDALDIVRAVRAKLGVPSQDEPGFKDWQAKYAAKATGHPRPVDKPARKPGEVDRGTLEKMAVVSPSRKDLQAQGYASVAKSSDLFKHGYSISHWIKPGEKGSEVIELNPRMSDLPRVVIRSGEEQRAVHEALGAPWEAPPAGRPSSAEDVAKVAVRAARRLKATIGDTEYDPASKTDTHKVMIEDAWREAKGELGGMGLEDFKAKLKEAWRAGKLDLARIDMPQFVKDNEHGSGYDRGQRSEVEHMDATFHSLHANDEKANGLVPPDKPPEPPPAPSGPTSIKNAVTENERARLGMPPPLAADPAGHSYPELADRARAVVERSPERVDALVAELAKRARPLTDEEDATILTRHVQLSNQYDQASAELEAARQGGSALDVEAAQKDVDALWAKKLQFYDVMKAVGTANGRGLAARRMMMARDFTLDRMQTVMRDAIGGAGADPEQLKGLMEETAKAHARIAALEKELRDAAQSHRVERMEAANGSYEQQVRDLAATILEEQDAAEGGIREAIALTRSKLKDVVTKRPDNPSLEQLAKIDNQGRYHLDLSNPANLRRFVGDGDHDSIPGWDAIVDDVARAHPDLLREESSLTGDTPADKLYELVTNPPKKLSRSEAKAEAVRRLAEHYGDLFAEEAPQKPTRQGRTSAARQEVDAAWEDLRKLVGGKLFSNPVDPELILATAKLAKAYVKLGVNKVADFIAKVAERIGHEPTEEEAKVLTAAWDHHTAAVAQERQDKLLGRLKDKVENPEAVSRAAKQLHREAALAGVDGRDERVKWVQARLAEVIPDITEGATADAIAGYGIYKPLSKDSLDVQLRDERGQLQQLGKLRDLEAGVAPKKTGIEQREPSQEERALIQKVNDRRKELGVQTSDPETQLKSALESAKTRMRNQIEDLADQLAKGQERERPKSRLQEDDALKTLRTVRDALKEDYAALFGEKARTLTDEQRSDMAEKAVGRQIAEYERQIAEKDFARKRGRRVDSDALAALRERRDALKAERDTLRDADAAFQAAKADKASDAESKRLQESIAELQERIAKGDVAARARGEEGAPENAALREQRDALAKQLAKMQREANAKPPKSKEEVINTRLQAEYARKIAELREKMARGDYSLPEKPQPVARTAETLRLQRQLEGEKQAFLREVERLRKLNAPLGEKLAKGVATFVRNSVISSPTTMAKILGASAWRMTTTPVKEIYGRVLAAVFRRIGLGELVERAAREGRGYYGKAELASWTEGMTKGFRDAWDQVRHGESELDRAFGTKDAKSGWAEFVGRLHSAAKAPAVRAEFARSMILRMENAQSHGVDVTNPENMLAIQLEAFRDSNRARFQQENWLVDFWNRGVSSLEKSDNGVARGTGATLRVLNPVVRVPTNLAFEIANHATGLGLGAVRVTRALQNGLDKLSPQQADAIMRNFKEGSLGVGLLLLGYFNAGRFGGGFTGRKRKDDELEPGSVEIMGVQIPAVLLHNPTVEMLQLGASIAHTEHERTKIGERGLGSGIGQAIADWGQEIPLIGHLARTVAGGFNAKPEERGYVVGETLKAVAIPMAIQWLAKQLDKPTPFDPTENPTKRSPRGVIERVETGIPGLRESVPRAKK